MKWARTRAREREKARYKLCASQSKQIHFRSNSWKCVCINSYITTHHIEYYKLLHNFSFGGRELHIYSSISNRIYTPDFLYASNYTKCTAHPIHFLRLIGKRNMFVTPTKQYFIQQVPLMCMFMRVIEGVNEIYIDKYDLKRCEWMNEWMRDRAMTIYQRINSVVSLQSQ